jgi:hypothetical protein
LQILQFIELSDFGRFAGAGFHLDPVIDGCLVFVRIFQDGQTLVFGLFMDGVNLCPSRNEIFSSSFRRAEILTAGIWLIFRGLKFPPNNEIGENSHLWMDTNL